MEFSCFIALAVFIAALVKIGQSASSKTSLSSLFPDVDADVLREHRSRLRRKRRRLRDRLEETLVPPPFDEAERVVEEAVEDLPNPQDVLTDAQHSLEDWGKDVEQLVTGGVAGVLGAMGIDHALDEKEGTGPPDPPKPPERDSEEPEAVVFEEPQESQPLHDTFEEAPAPEPVAPEPVVPEPEPITPEPAATSEPVSATTQLSDPTDLAADLFAEGRPGFEVKDNFERDHLGSRVHWRATVDRVEDYHRDSTLGDGPGTRVVATVATPDDGARPVRIELGLAREWGERLERGQEIEFEGELSACDPYLLSFSVKSASVVR